MNVEQRTSKAGRRTFKVEARAQAGANRPALYIALGLLVVLALVVFVRIRLLHTPLERDEGEYAYAGQLLLEGIPPYQDLYSMKWPGTFAAYAGIMGLFGQSIAAIHLGLLLTNLATAALLFFLARRIAGTVAGLVASVAFALLAIIPASFGLAAHATHFVLLPALGGVLLLEHREEPRARWRFVLAGILFGLAALMKQAGAAFGLFGVVWVGYEELSQPGRNSSRFAQRLGCLVAGGLLPLVLTAWWLAGAGVFHRFWEWTFVYSRAYVNILTPMAGLHRLFSNGMNLVRAAPALWALAAVGLTLLWFDRSLRPWRFFILSFLFFSFVAVCPGWYFRGHYFIVLFPAVALLIAVSVRAGPDLMGTQRRLLGALPVLVFGLAALGLFYRSRAIFFRLTPTQISRDIYALNPFPEAIEIGRYLKSHCPPDARVAVVGSEPEIYFYSHRRSATGYVYTYPLMEPQPYARAMQQEMIHELQQAKPDYFVFVSQPSSWLPQPGSDVSVMEWFINYRQEHLDSVGLVDILPDGTTQFSWSGTNNPRSDQWLQIYKSRPAPQPLQEAR
ncbi:MAG TPA: glycosyltransferase family 39 protein [Verrucomicrobiae bacterium]|nr:glycosyltransferase family 39 protein [Verrucomicrobiae bacterium]